MGEGNNNSASSLSSELFMELASESRFAILMSLSERRFKLSTLARTHGHLTYF